MPKKSNDPEYEPIYMDARALEFLRAWPDVPEGLRPAYSRLYDAGMLWADPQAPQGLAFPGIFRLTALGQAMKDTLAIKSINFFRVLDVFNLVETDKLVNRDAYATKFVGLFKSTDGEYLDWNCPTMRRYISWRLLGYEPVEVAGIVATIAALKESIARLTKLLP